MGQSNSKLCIETVNEMREITVFDQKEIIEWYQGFVSEFPLGYFVKTDINRIYGQFFPFGNSVEFSNRVFELMDEDQNGKVDFREFLKTFSIVARGGMEDKIQWSFKLYDMNGDGVIDREELLSVTKTIYNIASVCTLPSDESTAEQRVDKIFSMVGGKVISYNDYYQLSKIDPMIVRGMFIYDGIV
jgi:neuronal calcium sensor 1